MKKRDIINSLLIIILFLLSILTYIINFKNFFISLEDHVVVDKVNLIFSAIFYCALLIYVLVCKGKLIVAVTLYVLFVIFFAVFSIFANMFGIASIFDLIYYFTLYVPFFGFEYISTNILKLNNYWISNVIVIILLIPVLLLCLNERKKLK